MLYKIERLERIHNTAARVLTQTRKYNHIMPDLHWLPVQQSTAVPFRDVSSILTISFRKIIRFLPV